MVIIIATTLKLSNVSDSIFTSTSPSTDILSQLPIRENHMPESVYASSNTSDGDVIWAVDAMFPKSHARLCFPALIIIGHFPLDIGSRMDICMQLVYWKVLIRE